MNLYVLAWCVIAAVGAVLSALLLLESEFDRRALGGMQNGRRALVRGRIASESIRLVIHTAFLAIGIPALGTPTVFSINVLILILGNFGLILNSFISMYVRREVEVPVEPMTAEELVQQAEGAAREVLETAEKAATNLVNFARRTALDLDRAEMDRTLTDRTLTRHAAERTAANTKRIAENTEPESPDR